jgi:TetR/AcrR family tetracycline transcriptional repressor
VNPLSREAVVDAAVDVLHDVGIEAFTMRLVAQKLDAQLNSIYWYVPSKRMLLELMVNSMLTEVTAGDLPDDWTERVRLVAGRFRQALLTHRDGGRVAASIFSLYPNTLRIAEELMLAFQRAGLTTEESSWATWHIAYLVIGIVQEEQIQPEDFIGALHEAINVEEFPLLHESIAVHDSSDYFDERFAFTLSVFIDGLRTRSAGTTEAAGRAD